MCFFHDFIYEGFFKVYLVIKYFIKSFKAPPSSMFGAKVNTIFLDSSNSSI